MKNCKISKRAERLLQYLGIVDPSDIDVEVIARYCGAKVKYRNLSGCEASIVGVANKAIITIDSTSRYERRRFSIGHEIGHWMYDRGQGIIEIKCQPKDIGAQWSNLLNPEARANAFAAALLMPPYLFLPLTKNRDITLDTATELASQFSTSLTATSIQLVKSGSLPAMLVCFSHKKREWFVSGPDVPEFFYPLKKLDPESEAFDILYGEKKMCKPIEVTADIWIDRDDAGEYSLYEQSVKISDNMVLSMLWWKDESQIVDVI